MYRSMALVMVVLLAAVLITGLVQPVSAQEDVRTFEIPDRIHFNYSMQIAQDAGWQRVPASPDPQTPTGPIPEYTEITFQNYEEAAGWIKTGQYIHVYPVVTFPADPNAPYPHALEQLRAVLAARPNVPEDELPMLPIVTAAQIVRSQVQYLELANGSGIRYVTAAGLDVSPIEGALFYTFQGLTHDGAYYIAACFPVLLNGLPIQETMNTEQYDAFAAGYDAYLADITAQLNAAAPSDFSTDLTLLDSLFASMTVLGPEAAIVTPGDAAVGAVTFDNIQFSYDAALASRIEVDVIAPYTDPGGMSMFGSLPGMTVFSFLDYPVNRLFGAPVIRVMPVESFPGSDTVSDQALAHLQAFLAARPALAGQVNVREGASEPGIPVLPVINAAQVLIVKPQYIDFQNGRGVRFVTYYAQGLDPLTNGVIFYAFQGMTADGRFVVSAEFPLRVPVLPDSIDYTTLDYDAFALDYLNYLAETVTALGGTASGDYTPSLDTLDTLIQSVRAG